MISGSNLLKKYFNRLLLAFYICGDTSRMGIEWHVMKCVGRREEERQRGYMMLE